jgi:hypothetical protein
VIEAKIWAQLLQYLHILKIPTKIRFLSILFTWKLWNKQFVLWDATVQNGHMLPSHLIAPFVTDPGKILPYERII